MQHTWHSAGYACEHQPGEQAFKHLGRHSALRDELTQEPSLSKLEMNHPSLSPHESPFGLPVAYTCRELFRRECFEDDLEAINDSYDALGGDKALAPFDTHRFSVEFLYLRLHGKEKL